MANEPSCPDCRRSCVAVCDACEARLRWEKQRTEFVLTDESRMQAEAMIRGGVALSGEPVTRDTALAAVLALAIFASETGVTWVQLHDALRKEFDRASARRTA